MTIMVSAMKQAVPLYNGCHIRGVVWEATMVWMVHLRVCGYVFAPTEKPSRWKKFLQCILAIYFALILAAKALTLVDAIRSGYGDLSNWFTSQIMKLLDVTQICGNVLAMILLCLSGRRIAQLIHALDESFAVRIAKTRLRAVALGMALFLLIVLMKNAYRIYAKQFDPSVARGIENFQQRYPFIQSPVIAEYVYRFYCALDRIFYMGYDFLVGFMLTIMLLSSKGKRATALNLDGRLVKAMAILALIVLK
ncbi:uncharacterized protein LOC129601668 [Paramacrobiotus metropolitanus]|uniref:uncharacterized protein LOC129601668 n=1 Tax=Paramacrobiotus metropolitanus TaxID=2943436 RepID=UPI002445DBBC|nr:uncharacterized protein LOC129601668 [Paramacrobiotus metropolitanus]